MTKDPKVFIKHILQSIILIEEYTKPLSKQEFLRRAFIQDAVIRRLEIIGEAVKNLPPDFKGRYPDIPWQQIAGMRDVLIHEYFGVDLNLTWQTVREDIPSLKSKLEEILQQIP
jgi:uncharacterized protein with HEPN domain